MSTTPLRLLVLDDDAMIRRAFQRIASCRDDITLEAVGTPTEVLERIEAEAFDLVVCDYRLQLGGEPSTSTELVAALRARGVAVAVMTGYAENGMDALGVPVVEKPVRIDDLIALVRT